MTAEFTSRIKQVIEQGLATLGKPRNIKHGAEADEFLRSLLAGSRERLAMGLHFIGCPLCGSPHYWFSGNLDQRCENCKHLGDATSATTSRKALSTEDVGSPPPPLSGRVAAIVKDMAERFTSGNSVTVERVHIKRDEWDAIVAELLTGDSSAGRD